MSIDKYGRYVPDQPPTRETAILAAIDAHARGALTPVDALDAIEGLVRPGTNPTPTPAPPRVYAGLEAEAKVMRDELTAVAGEPDKLPATASWAARVLQQAQAAAFLAAHVGGAQAADNAPREGE